MPKRGWMLIFVAALLVALLLSTMAASAQSLQRVRLSEVVRSVFYAPQYVALEKGFFEDEGLAIDLSTAWGVVICRDTAD